MLPLASCGCHPRTTFSPPESSTRGLPVPAGSTSSQHRICRDLIPLRARRPSPGGVGARITWMNVRCGERGWGDSVVSGRRCLSGGLLRDRVSFVVVAFRTTPTNAFLSADGYYSGKTLIMQRKRRVERAVGGLSSCKSFPKTFFFIANLPSAVCVDLKHVWCFTAAWDTWSSQLSSLRNANAPVHVVDSRPRCFCRVDDEDLFLYPSYRWQLPLPRLPRLSGGVTD